MQGVKRVRGRRRGGFTLLEVLVVIGIIALLAAFVVPSLMRTRESAELDVAKRMVESGGTLAMAIDLFHLHMRRYPTELSELYEDPEDEEDLWKGPYIEDASKLKDPWQHELQYKGGEDAEYNEGRYDLWSMGPDGEDGSEDDIGNWSKEE